MVLFWGSYLSNWQRLDRPEHGLQPIVDPKDGQEYSSTEQYYKAAAARVAGDDEALAGILRTRNVAKQKARGRAAKGLTDENWTSAVKYDVLVEANWLKYSQNPVLADALLATGDRKLAEASPVDAICGIGLHWSDDAALDVANWAGENLLGRALEEVRDRLRKEVK